MKKLNCFHVAALYVGTLMGAGFASGREGWQFFGVFGMNGYMGLAIAGFLFMTIGMMVSYIARTLHTDDMGRIIVFVDHPKLTAAIGYFMAAILYTIIISMSAAGGSFLAQQFGLPQAVGGIIIVVLVIITVLGDFERISKVFRLIVPALFIVDMAVCMIVICSDIEQSGATSGFPASSMASTWLWSSIIFVSYNMLGMIPIVGASSVNAKSKGHGIFGAGLGGFLLAALTFMLITGLRKDMAFSNSMDLPMLAYSGRISPVANLIFGVILFAAIYSAATSTYYGFSTKIKNGPRKKYILIAGAAIGFVCGLTGFKTIVAYLYPVEGYIGLTIMASIIIHFFRVLLQNKKGESALQQEIPSDQEICALFDDYDRYAFPDGIRRVTAGAGGEAILIFGPEKTALYDTGMAYCHDGLVDNIKGCLSEFGRSGLDCVLLSHTHYDHIGALPYVILQWPDVQVYGAAKAREVFESQGAKKTMKRLGEEARNNYAESKEDILTDPMRVDHVVKDGDHISLGGDMYIHVLETKGHTDCSLAYVLEPESLMFTSESTGVMRFPPEITTAILKDFQDTLNAADKCKAYGAKQLVVPHSGLLPEGATPFYFDLYRRYAEEERDFILQLYDRGLSREQITMEFEKRFWSDRRGEDQPKAAFLENAKYSIKHILEVFR
ncbi:MBL fold metallo-hydrolase [Ihubacter sp. rT4E-8]|uniref:MBL fold metallo-hydrolase n=1 Tax=Ihubacter sp. rT4E-8 TaxID=3242369 RepID=UPI003CED8B18